MRFGIMGAGSIGCFVGGRLAGVDASAATGDSVVFIGRETLREATATYGLTVLDIGGSRVVVPPAACEVSTTPADLRDCDVVFVCVKSAATEATARDLAKVLRAGSVVVSLQNGLQNAETLERELPEQTVVAGIVSFNVVSLPDATVQRTMNGPILLQRVPNPLFAKAVETMKNAAGLDVTVCDAIVPEQVSKLVVNLNNAISALSGAPTVQLMASSAYRRIIADVVEEALSVLSSGGIVPASFRGVPLRWMPPLMRLPTLVVRVLLRAQMKVDPEARSSMWEDLSRGRATEVDFLNGEIVRRAEATGSPAPLNRRIVDLVHAAEENGGSPNLSAEALRAALDAR